MKNLRLTLAAILLLTAGTVHAGHEFNSTLLFHQRDYLPVIAELDYVPGPSYPQREFTFSNVSPGRHYLRIYKPGSGYHHYGMQVLYNGYVDVPARTVMTSILNNHGLQIISAVPMPVYGGPAVCPPAAYNPPAPCYNGMEPQRYQALKASIAARSFDSTRLKLAKQAVREQHMNSDQVAGLVDLLSFDSSRLELAKYAFHHVSDPENYFTLYDLFAFDSSVRELSEYIGRFG